MAEDQRQRLRNIKTFNQLLAFLRDDLDWPIEDVDDEDDLTFDWSDDLGLKDEERVGIKAIKQLRPLESGQPWGIFFIDFEKKRLPIVILRRILNALVMKKRAGANRAERAAWKQHDLLFISAYGEQDDRELTFAHFSEPTGELTDTKPTLRVLGWDDEDTNLKLDYVADMLHAKLVWPKDSGDLVAWRSQWSQAFELRPRQIIDTAQELALRLAELAKRIRNRAMLVLPRESESGALRKLMKGFKTALIHDLTDESFADMYAQTITYGLFSAAVSRTVPGAGTAVVQEDVVAMVPVTNPFLKEMLESFLRAGGRRGKLDFDELGIQEVVELLRDPQTRLGLVLKDFGKRTRGEDPVIHFYEHFLSAYNKKLKVQRGVFYTPQPVVSYIVRSVHELLQTEFGLDDGLADTTTWGEMISQHPHLQLPMLQDDAGDDYPISADEPFVQILDPATGTATFLVEVIDVIYGTLAAKWKQQHLTDAQRQAAWNDYVPQHLLPRLHAFELMMAPYAIAHMKIGLKLAETGYRFGTEERARIYLTNALEPWVKQLPLIGFDALAHEAAAVNEIKRHKRFTVVIGNPPYSGRSYNLSSEARALIEPYKFIDGFRIKEKGALQLEKNLNDDYVKFLRLAQVTTAGMPSVVGVITNHSFLENPTLRGVRWSLFKQFSRIRLMDLGGNVARREKVPDENVFDITQGVAISLLSSAPEARSGVSLARLKGSRQEKYEQLRLETSHIHFTSATPDSLLYLFRVEDEKIRGEYLAGVPLNELFILNSTGVKTHRDEFCMDFERHKLVGRIEDLIGESKSDEEIRKDYGLKDTHGWRLSKCRVMLRKNSEWKKAFSLLLYRPFDWRHVYFSSDVIELARMEVSENFIDRENIGLVFMRQVASDEPYSHFGVTRHPVDNRAFYSNRGTMSFAPLYRYRDKEPNQLFRGRKESNFNPTSVAKLKDGLGLIGLGAPDPADIFSYAYAVFHSPGYRSRYAEFLKIDFPRLPLTGVLELFRALARLGGELTGLHLLESLKLAQPITEFIGGRHPEVEKISWSRNTVWVDKAQTTGFQGVREEVWNFHIGGYQVCQKWLKDRGPKKGKPGRTLTDGDIAHYHKIVVALSETIRLMAEIDRVIDEYGGWPNAFTVREQSA